MVAAISPVIDDFAEFLAGLAPKKLLDYKAPQKAQERMGFLLSKNKEGKLSENEQEEIGYYMMMEHLVRVAKARALQRLNANEK